MMFSSLRWAFIAGIPHFLTNDSAGVPPVPPTISCNIILDREALIFIYQNSSQNIIIMFQFVNMVLHTDMLAVLVIMLTVVVW